MFPSRCRERARREVGVGPPHFSAYQLGEARGAFYAMTARKQEQSVVLLNGRTKQETVVLVISQQFGNVFQTEVQSSLARSILVLHMVGPRAGGD